MTDFRVPPGDPGALRAVVGRLSTLAGTVVDTRASRLGTLRGEAAAKLPTARVAAFTGAADQARTATDAVGTSLVAVGGALADYAEALQTAQDTVRSARSGWDAAAAGMRDAHHLADTTAADSYRRDMSTQESLAQAAHSALTAARQRAASALSTETSVWLPDAGTLTPVEAWSRAAAEMVPAGVGLDPDALREAYDSDDLALAGGAVVKAFTTTLNVLTTSTLLKFLRAPGLARRAENGLAGALARYQALKGAGLDLTDPGNYREYLKAEREALKLWAAADPEAVNLAQAQREFSLIRGLLGDAKAVAQITAKYGVPGTLLPKVSLLETLKTPLYRTNPLLSRVLGPVSIGLGAYDVYGAVTDDSKPMGDRVARGVGGLATAIGGGTTTLMAVGLLGANPVGLGIVAVTGAVALGAWAYENREQVADTAKKVGTTVKDTAKKVWKGLFG